MSKYRRQHEGPNMSKGFLWLFGLGIVAYIIYKVVVFKQNVDEVQEIEKGSVPEGSVYSIDTVLGNMDTVRLK